MDAVRSLNPVKTAAAPFKAAPAPASAPSAPADSVQVSAPSPGRAWLWTGLATAGLMGGNAVGGPLGAALNAQQKAALREVLADLNGNGVRFFVDKGLLGGVFSTRYPDKSPDEVMAMIEGDKPDFQSKLWVKREGVETHKFRSLGFLQAMDSFYGQSDPAALPEGQAARALRNLSEAGWTFHTRESSYNTSEESRTGALGAWNHLAEGSGRQITVVRPDGRTFDYLKTSDLGPLAYFEGSGDASLLAHPDLATRLKQVVADGYEFEAEGYPNSGRGLRGVYQNLEQKQTVRLKLGEMTLGTIKTPDPAAIDGALAAARELVGLYEKQLKPEVEGGRIDAAFRGLILEELKEPVAGHTLEQRMDQFKELARAVRSGPDSKRDLATQTRSAYETYKRIRRQGHTGAEFTNAVTLAAGLISQVGSTQADAALKFLTEEIPKSSLFPEARREREGTFLRLMRALGDVKVAIDAVPLADTRLGNEDREARLQALEGLARAGRHQKGYANLRGDWEAMLASRLPEQSLEEAGKVYTLLLGALARAGQAGETAPTWRFLQDGLRHGYFEEASSAAVVDRFLSVLLLTRDPDEARKKFMEPVLADRPPGTIQDGEQDVNVGGVVLPKKPD